MDFLWSSTWAAVAVAASLAVLLRQFGLRGFGTLSPSAAATGEVGRVVVAGVAVWLTGWVGAVAIAALAYLVLPIVADLLLFPLLRKGTMTTFGDFRSAVPWRGVGGDAGEMSLERIFAKGDERDQRYYEIARQPAIAKVLLDYGKPPEDVKRIANMLTLEGLGYRIPLKIVSDPKLLAEHYRLEAEGVEGMRLVSTYIERFGHVT